MSNKLTIKELLEDMDARLKHIEDISADNRAVIIKLVKQSNQIVEFLKQVDVESEEVISMETSVPTLGNEDTEEFSSKFKSIKELVDEFMAKQKDLKDR